MPTETGTGISPWSLWQIPKRAPRRWANDSMTPRLLLLVRSQGVHLSWCPNSWTQRSLQIQMSSKSWSFRVGRAHFWLSISWMIQEMVPSLPSMGISYVQRPSVLLWWLSLGGDVPIALDGTWHKGLAAFLLVCMYRAFVRGAEPAEPGTCCIYWVIF